MKLKIVSFFAVFYLCSATLTAPSLKAQEGSGESDATLSLTKQVIEAKSNNEAYLALEELTDIYFKGHRYNDFVSFLKSLAAQKKSLEPAVNYYTGLTRYYQMKYLEETENWDEYFSQGNTYRDEITVSLEKTVNSLEPDDALAVYAKLMLWKFHKDQQDTGEAVALVNLMESVLSFAKSSDNIIPLKDVADQLSSYGERGKAKEIYNIYVEKLVKSDISDKDLYSKASDFFKEGKVDLSEVIFDAYIDRVLKTLPKDESIAALKEIAGIFAYNDGGNFDTAYAENVFKRIEEAGGKDALDEGSIYLRAYNLEKAKEYLASRDKYLELINRFPRTTHADEAEYKLGMINVYIARDLKLGTAYFEKISQKEPVTPQVISSLYQLGLLSQWGADTAKATEYYKKLIEKSRDNFQETIELTRQRLKEIEESAPIEYNLKMFIDVSLKSTEGHLPYDMSKASLTAKPYRSAPDKDINVNSSVYTSESGCMSVELQYLWSGHLGKERPKDNQPNFTTSYIHPGAKEINLVVVSPSGVIDRSLDFADIY